MNSSMSCRAQRGICTSAADRRGFLSSCACLLAAGVTTACASLAVRPVPRSGDTVRMTLAAYPDLAKPGGSVRVLPDGLKEPVYILALENNQYAALSPICTHRGCTVEIEGARLVCPCHGSTYDREGKVLRGPAEQPLARHQLTVVGGELVIQLIPS